MEQKPFGQPLPLERNEKLKIFAVLSADKTLPLESINGRLALTLMAAYNQNDARQAAIMGIQQLGRDPATYVVPYMDASVEAEKLVQMAASMTPVPVVVPELEQRLVEPSVEEVIEWVTEVFSKFGTFAQRKAAASVVEKYKKHGHQISRIVTNIRGN